MTQLTINGRAIGPSEPAYVIAELAWAHDGDVEKAARIINGAADAGTDAFCLHVTSLPDYMVRHYGNAATVSAGKPTSDIYDYLDKLNLTADAIAQLVQVIRARGMAVALMPNDRPSLEFAKSLKADALVLAPACFVEEAFVRALSEASAPVILRIGGATIAEIEQALCWLEHAPGKLLLHGLQSYPTPIDETHLRSIAVLERMFGYPVGLADHIDGGDELAMVIPAVAVACGAVAFEKHITWDRAERGEDFESALSPAQFTRFVRAIRAAQAAMGRSVPAPRSEIVKKYRSVSRKRVVAAVAIAEGTALTHDHLVCKRSDAGASPEQLQLLLGRRTLKELAADEPVTAEVVE